VSNLSNIIFSADDIESELVEVKAWGVTVLVKSMTARDRARMINSSVTESGGFQLEDILPDMVIASTYDPETGERVFQDGDRDALMSKSAAPIEQIATIAMRLSGMEENSVDEAGKEFLPTTTDGSSLN
jgi:hypothetical protein